MAINNKLELNNYLVFDCFFLNNYKNNDILEEIIISDENKYWDDEIINKYVDFTKKYYLNNWPTKYKGWITHHKINKKKIHYMCAIFKSDLEKVDYFTEDYKDGFCFDDDEIIRKIELNNINVEFFSNILEKTNYSQSFGKKIFTIHQHHERNTKNLDFLIKWEKNKHIFVREHKKYTNIYLNYYIHKNIFNKNITKQNITVLFDEENNSYKINNISHSDNFIKLIPFIKFNEINYTANVENIIFNENINEIFNNCIFEFSCSVTNNNNINNLKILNNTDIITLPIIDNNVNYTGPLYNILNGLVICNIEQNVIITNPEIILRKINFINNGSYTIDGLTWKYKKIPKIASTYFYNEITQINYTSFKTFYEFNPDWLIKIYISNDCISLNADNEYYNSLVNNNNIEIININFTDIYTELNTNDINSELQKEYMSYYFLSLHGGLWFDPNIVFIKPIISLNINSQSNDNDNIDVIISYNNSYLKTIMFCSYKNELFSYIFEEIKKNNINEKITNNNSILEIFFNNTNEIYSKFNDLKLLNMRSKFLYNQENFIANEKNKYIITNNYYCIYYNKNFPINNIKNIDNYEDITIFKNLFLDDYIINLSNNNNEPYIKNDNEITILLNNSEIIYYIIENKVYNIATDKEEGIIKFYGYFISIQMNNGILFFYYKDIDNIYKSYVFKDFDFIYYKKQCIINEIGNEINTWIDGMVHWIEFGYVNNIKYSDTASLIINNTLLNIRIDHSHEHIHDIKNNIYYKLSFNNTRNDILYINLNWFELNNNNLKFNSDIHNINTFIKINNVLYLIDDSLAKIQ